MSDLPKTITLWKWRVYNTQIGRWHELPHHMTVVEQAAQDGRRIERVEGSSEERTPITEGWGQCVPPAPDKRPR